MAATSNFAVHSFHINIDIGDAAIHLRVDETTRPKPTVYQAVFIDGGLSGARPYAQTAGVIREIEEVYTPDPASHFDYVGPVADNVWLRFDAIIVTHFDIDHYGGVIYLINEGFRVTAEAETAKLTLEVQNAMASTTDPFPKAKSDQSAWVKKHDAVKQQMNKIAWVQNRFMKYSSVVPGFADPPTNTDALLTTLYLPYMTEVTRAHRKAGFLCRASYDPKKCWATPSNVLGWELETYVNQIDNYPTGLLKNTLKTGAKRTFKLDYVCKLVADPESYLGADVLFTVALPKNEWKNLENPGQLVKKHNLEPEHGPRIYIVAGLQTVLGNKQNAVTAASVAGGKTDPFSGHIISRRIAANATRPQIEADITTLESDLPPLMNGSLPIRPKPDTANGVAHAPGHLTMNLAPTRGTARGPKHFPTFVVDEPGSGDGILSSRGWKATDRNDNSFAKNAASICCMVLSRTSDDDDAKAFKALHYFGGDALWDTETGIAIWATPGGTPLEMEAMKMSHHGAMASLPIAMLDAFKPKRIIGSVGSGRGKDMHYGHPRSELMLYLAAWLRKWKDIDATRPDEAIFTLNYPAYFKLYPKSKSTITLTTWTLQKGDAEGTPNSVWRARLWDLCDEAKIVNKDENILANWGPDRYDQTRGGWSRKNNQDLLVQTISQLYDKWEGCKPGVARVAGHGVSDTVVPRCIELRLTANPGGTRVTTWRGTAPTGRVPYTMTSPPATHPVRVVGTPEVSPALLGPLTRTEGSVLGKRARDVTLGVSGVPADPTSESRRPDSMDIVVEETTDAAGPAGVDDADEEGSSLGVATDDVRMEDAVGGHTSRFATGPMGQPFLRAFNREDLAVHGDPFVRGNAAPMTTTLAPAPAATSDQLLRLYATSFQGQAPQLGSQDILLLGTNNAKLDAFVDSLPVGYLTCNAPAASSSEYQIVAGDEWLQRLNATGLGFTSFSVFGTIVPPENGSSGSMMHILSLNAVLTLQRSTLIFSSTNSHSVCGLLATTSSYADALLDSHTILTLGVATVTPDLSVTLADLIPANARLVTWIALFSLAALSLKLDTSPQSRTAVSFQPGEGSVVWRRLQLLPSDPTWTLAHKLPFLGKLGISFSNHQFILRSQVMVLRNALTATVTEIHELVVRTTVTITQPGNFQAIMWWVFGDSTTSLVVCFSEDQDLGSIVTWIVNLLNTNADAHYTEDDVHPDKLFSDMPNTKQAGQTGPKAFIQQINLTLNTPEGEIPSIENFKMILEIDLFGAAFKVELSGPPVRLSASLWTMIPDTTIIPKPGANVAGPYVPFLDDYQTLHPFGDVSGQIKLSELAGSDNGSSPPLGLQVVINELSLDLERSSGSTKASFGGTILCDKPADGDDFPHLDIAAFSIYGDFETDGPTTKTSYDIKLETQIFLLDLRTPKPEQPIPPAALDVSAEASDGVWTFSAAALDLQFGALYQIFDKDASGSVVDVLSHIYVPDLEMVYVYSPTEPNTLNVTGTLVIGTLELEMTYMYTAADTKSNKPKIWTIEAFLGVVGEKTHTIGSVVSGLDPDIGGFLEDVPFVKDCSLPVTPALDDSDDAGFTDAPVQLFCSSDGTYTVLCFRIEIVTPAGALSCTCVRFQPTTMANVTLRPRPKIILRVALDKLPSIPDVPVVGSLPQPVDDIDYLFVRDPNAADGVPSGITDIELSAINAILVQGQFTEIPARNIQSNFKASGANASSANYVLLAGHHFLARVEGSVILDYLFGKGSGTPPSVPATETPPGERKAGLAKQETAVTSGAMKKSFGPLTVSNFGIQMKNGYLYFVLDLGIAIGPVQLTIIGFGIGVSLRAFNLNQLAHISVEDFSIILSGMSVYCNVPPLLIGGVFIHEDDALAELYEGGLTVSMLPYTLTAVGAYRRKKPNGFKSVFVFARFDGPLLSLEFAELSGVEAGFGYNYDLTMPTADDVLEFPFLHSQVATNNPMDILDQFGTWSTPTEGHFWFAIGCKIDAFELLSMEAAIMISFSADGEFKVGLAGLATASMPPMVTKREEAFLYVELGVVGAIDTGQGSTWIEASLTPNSFILYPDCHLTGGFALCYWFQPSPYEGDWVFTVGGYHPAFKAPPYYPQVDPVGISWNLNDNLTVKGGSFFAITPNAAMAGGRLDATFSVWFVYAYFEAWAMMLLKFKPFFFIADIGVSVGCGVHLSVGIIHVSFSIDIGGSLHLSGPRFGGTIYVDLKVHTFSIDFGDQDNTPDALDWPGFLNTVRQSGPKAASDNETTDLIVALVDGSATENTKSTQSTAATTDSTVKPTVWSVRSGTFVFRVESKVPVDHASISDGTQTGRVATASSNLSPTYARLMEQNVKDTIESTLAIIVKPAATAADADSNPWQLTPMVKNLPLALWDKYDPKKDPIISGNSISDQLNPTENATKAGHCVGYIVTAPKPALPLPQHILPEFNAADAMEEGIFPDGGTPPRSNRPLINPPITDDQRPRIIKADGNNSPEFYPQLRQASLTQPADLWTNVKDTWAAANASDAQLIADAWTDFMGWADAKAQPAPLAPSSAAGSAGSGGTTAATTPVSSVAPFTALQAGVPSVMLGQFDDYFLGLPRVCLPVA